MKNDQSKWSRETKEINNYKIVAILLSIDINQEKQIKYLKQCKNLFSHNKPLNQTIKDAQQSRDE